MGIPAEVMAELLRELDPLEIGQVNSLLSAWAGSASRSILTAILLWPVFST